MSEEQKDIEGIIRKYVFKPAEEFIDSIGKSELELARSRRTDIKELAKAVSEYYKGMMEELEEKKDKEHKSFLKLDREYQIKVITKKHNESLERIKKDFKYSDMMKEVIDQEKWEEGE